MKALAIVVVSLLALGVMIFFAMRDFVMTTGTCTACKTIYTLAAPPSDYYDPLAEELRLTGADGKFSATFSLVPRYHGRHSVAVLSPDIVYNSSTILFSIVCTSASNKVKRASGTKKSNMHTGVVAGVGVLNFSAPEDVGIGERMNCELEFSGASDMSPLLRVEKISDI